MSSSFLLAILAAAGPFGRVDLNTATLEQLRALEGITDEQADSIYSRALSTGGFADIYEVAEIPGMTASSLAWLRDNCMVSPRAEGSLSPAVMDLMERLAVEDGPGDAAVDEWENLLIRPMPVNGLRHWDLRMLDRVSIVDAAAVERRLRDLGPVSGVASLRGSDGLSYYGYRNLRDYVATRELDLSSTDFFGGLRVTVDGGAGRSEGEGSLAARLDDLGSAIGDMESGGRDYSGSPVDSAALYEQLVSERDELAGARGVTGSVQRLRLGLGDRWRGGIRLSRGRWSTAGHGLLSGMDMGVISETYDVAKAFASLHRLGPLHQVILGNYRLSLNQGLLVDNADELMSRSLYRPRGLHPDLTSTRQAAFTGAACEVRSGPLVGYAFVSSAPRDAIMNSDGTPNSLVLSRWRTSAMAGALQETAAGGYGYFDLGGFLPCGTFVGAGALTVSWSDSLVPDPEFLDIPNDAEVWNCPEYSVMPQGDALSAWSVSGQTVLGGFGVEGEAAMQDNDAMAAVGGARWQNDWFYLLCSIRHYDLEYTNPYCRGFAEQSRFDDTVFEKPYYLNDPSAADLADWPVPKPEEGIYLESRFQVSRQILFPKVYLDVWRSIPWGFENYRFQGELEYRPVFPLRFRLKYKLQDKTKMQDLLPTSSVTHEATLRTIVLPAGGDYFEIGVRAGLVELTPNPLYTDDRLMSGGFLSARWEHRFTPGFSVLGGTTLWTTDGMSQWEFEDTGIDFLDGRGTKFYVTVKEQISDNIQIRLRLLRKDTFFPRNGLYRPDPEDQYYYEGDPGSPVRDFGDHAESYGINCQLDLRW
ncbi:helix-hairpin-helix domain-containing protein [Candidatus Fermentibacteria bacterium]|nr:helix-hairpin-helix domain-containing protein [Candidatus Fermentibacteria bacterium]